MTIVAVSDTNIFIDLLETSLLEKLFHLPWEIHMEHRDGFTSVPVPPVLLMEICKFKRS